MSQKAFDKIAAGLREAAEIAKGAPLHEGARLTAHYIGIAKPSKRRSAVSVMTRGVYLWPDGRIGGVE